MADNYVNKDNLKQTLEKLKGEIDKKGGTPHFKGTTAEVLAHYGVSSLDDIPEGNITTVTDIEPESYTLPVASATELGGIKVGNNLSIDENGVLNATGGSGDASDINYDNTDSKLEASNVQDAIDEVQATSKEIAGVVIELSEKAITLDNISQQGVAYATTANYASILGSGALQDQAKIRHYSGTPRDNCGVTFFQQDIDNLCVNVGIDGVGAVGVNKAKIADTATDDTKLPLAGGTITGDIKPDETGKYYIGTADNAFGGVYARTIASRLNGGTYGSINVAAEGTETTNGACRLTVGNSTASGTDKNAYGEIRLFNTGTNYVGLRTSNDLTANRTIYLPATSGTKTLAIDDEATTTAKGLMSAADKTKLDGIAEGANKTTTVNNLTTTTAGSVLDARQGRALANGSARDNTKLALTGGTMTGQLVLNGTSIQFQNTASQWSPGKIDHNASQNLQLSATEEGYNVNIGVANNSWSWYPSKTKVTNLGGSSYRWNQLFAVTGTIDTSDRNEKKDIASLNNNQTKDFVMKLKPVSYKFKDGTSGRTHYGFIAQDVEESMNELNITSMDFGGLCKDLKEGSDNEYLYGLRYDEFIAPLVVMIQQQQKEIDGLKAEIEALKQNNINAM